MQININNTFDFINARILMYPLNFNFLERPLSFLRDIFGLVL